MSNAVRIPIAATPALNGKLLETTIEGYVWSGEDNGAPALIALSDINGQPQEQYSAKDIYQNRSAKHIDPAALMRAGLLQALWIEANKSKSMARLSLEYERQLAANKDDARGDYRRMMDAAE